MSAKKNPSNIPSEFDKEILRRYIEKYSFPRQIGSAGEKLVRKLVYRDFKKMGFKAHREHFICSLFYSVNFLRISLLSLIFMVIIMEYVQINAPIYNIFVITLFSLWGIILLQMSQKPHKINWGKNYLSSNIFTFVPAKTYGKIGNIRIFSKISDELLVEFEDETEEDIPIHDDYEDGADADGYLEYGRLPSTEELKYGNIIISAHTDSKSQSITTRARVRMFKTMLIIFVLLFALFLIGILISLIGATWISPIFDILTIVVSITVIIFVAILFLNKNQNQSPGATDNASGMAVVFALADYFKDKPLDRFNLYFCQFGVEEFGQQGARRFVLNRLKQFKRGRTFNFNLDMVGAVTEDKLPFLESMGLFRKPVDPLMASFLENNAKKLDIELDGFNLPVGAHTDRMAFTKYGYNGIDFASKECARWTHTPEDTPDKVNIDLLQKACMIIKASVEDMDEKLKNNHFEEPRDAKHIRQAYY